MIVNLACHKYVNRIPTTAVHHIIQTFILIQ